MIVAIIPARGGSRRIPRKNIRLFHGKPIIAHSIETAKASGLFDKIFVSTEDKEIGGIAIDLGAEWWVRPSELAEIGVPDCGTQEVARDVIERMWRYHGQEPHLACCIYATAPLMTVYDIARGFNAVADGGFDYAYAVDPDQIDAGQFYWSKVEALLARRPLNVARHQDNAYRVQLRREQCCDINEEFDWLRAERMYQDLYRESEMALGLRGIGIK